jgi:hypothetical protein
LKIESGIAAEISPTRLLISSNLCAKPNPNYAANSLETRPNPHAIWAFFE